MPKYDAKALQVARAVRQREQPELTILFGSRSRGDHDESWSDIDIMLVTARESDANEMAEAKEAARAAVSANYGHHVPVQLVWCTLDTFRHNRRYTNSLETNAVRDGIIMPKDPEQYGSSHCEDAETEYEYDWSTYENRREDAMEHLEEFRSLVERGRSDQLIGLHAQGALEHGMKALLEAHRAQYRFSHEIGELLGNVRHVDPAMAEFSLSIDPDIYSRYAGRRAYVRPPTPMMLTNQPDYPARTVADAQLIIERARIVRSRA